MEKCGDRRDITVTGRETSKEKDRKKGRQAKTQTGGQAERQGGV
jgi:hypothetical protein